MATRAIDIAEAADGVTCRQVGWGGLFDRAFVAAWDGLAVSSTEPNAFCESWFLGPALRQFDPQGRVQIFTFWDGPTLCGLMPLSTQPRYGRWPMPHVQNWLHHNAFLGTPLVRTGYEEAFWRALFGTFDAAPGQSLFAHFNGLRVDGPIAMALSKVAAEQRRICALVHQEARALLERGMTPDAYYEAAVRAKKRKELRRQKNRLSEEGVLTFVRYAGDEGLDAWTDEFLALEQRGWKGTNGSALGCAPETRNLFVEVLKGAAHAGKLERLELRLDSRPLAMLVNFHCAPGSFSFKTAFDEDYARFSPGVLLQIENLALLEQPHIDWCDSCAVEGHPMIDSLWTGRRTVGRYSVAIGGSGRRAVFGALLKAELGRAARRKAPIEPVEHEDENGEAA